MKFYIPLFIFLAAFYGSAQAAIELTTKENAGISRTNDPVTYGVPLSHSDNIKSVAAFKITTDKAGSNPVDAQFRVLSRYNDTPGGNGAIRVVLVDFQSSIAANGTKKFYLHTSGGQGTSSGLLASNAGSDIVVSTGTMSATLDSSSGWLSSLLIDANGDGSVNVEALGNAGNDGFHIKALDGKTYSSLHGVSDLVIEENGPLRAVVRATGYFEDSGNNRLVPAKADNGLEYTLRFYFYKNKSYVKVAATLKNENLGWTNDIDDYPAHPIYIDHAYLNLTTAIDDAKETVNIGGDTFTGKSAYSVHVDETSNGSTQSYNWVQTTNGSQTSNKKFDSYLDVRDSSLGVMTGMRWMWQQHPKAFRVEGGGDELYVDLWPNESQNHRILGGMWKTHEVVLYFHNPAATDQVNTLAVLQDRLIARPDDVYIAQTNFFYSIPPATIQSDHNFHANEPNLSEVLAQDNNIRRARVDSDHIEHSIKNNSIVEMRENRGIPGPGNPAYWTWYGWLEFGNMPRGSGSWGYSSAHYDWSYSTLVSWLRFEKYDYLDLAEEFVSHQADISILHDQQALTTGTWGDKYHGGHRYEQDALFSFYDTYSASKKNAPATGSHFWTKGIALQYMLTGDFRYLDALEDTVQGRIHNYFSEVDCTNDCSDKYSLRDKGRSFEGILTGYLVMGKPEYLTRAKQMYQNAIKPLSRKHQNGEYFESIVKDREASLLQSGTTIEPLIHLYSSLKNSGQTSDSQAVLSTLEKQGIWYRDTIYTNASCSEGVSGTYTGSSYVTFGQCKIWDREANYGCGSCSKPASFGYFFGRRYATDLFAFLYKSGLGDDWLDLARSVFKDEVVYGSSPIGVYPISSTFSEAAGWKNPDSGNAWAKSGQTLKKGLFYMHTEWSKGSPQPPIPDPDPEPEEEPKPEILNILQKN